MIPPRLTTTISSILSLRTSASSFTSSLHHHHHHLLLVQLFHHHHVNLGGVRHLRNLTPRPPSPNDLSTAMPPQRLLPPPPPSSRHHRQDGRPLIHAHQDSGLSLKDIRDAFKSSSITHPPMPMDKLYWSARAKQRNLTPKIASAHVNGINLPTTFPTGIATAWDWRQQVVRAEPSPISHDPLHFPYRYYEITLTRGVLGLPKKVREQVRILGFTKTRQVLYKEVHPKIAGMILKIKELVRVRLVNEPLLHKPKATAGYTIEKKLITQNCAHLK